VYHWDGDGVLRADGVVVLAPTAADVAHVTRFHDPGLVATFGFPVVFAAGGQEHESAVRSADCAVDHVPDPSRPIAGGSGKAGTATIRHGTMITFAPSKREYLIAARLCGELRVNDR